MQSISSFPGGPLAACPPPDLEYGRPTLFYGVVYRVIVELLGFPTPTSRRTSMLVRVLALGAILASNSLAQDTGSGHRESGKDIRQALPGTHRTSPPANPSIGGFAPVQVNVNASGNNIVGDAGNEPSLAIDPNDPNRIVIGWRQFDTTSSSFRQAGWGWSHDNGRRWAFPGRIEAGLFRSDPVLDVTAEGMFWYCSLQGDFSVQFFPSPASGISWDSGFDAFGGDKQWIAIDRTSGIGHGNMYMAWSIAAGCCGSRVFTRSVDGGATWMNPIDIPETPVWGTLALDADGRLFISGVEGDNFDPGNIVVIRSSDARIPAGTPSFDQVTFVDLGGRIEVGEGPNPGGLLGQVWIAADTSGGPAHGNLYLAASVNPPGGDPLDVHFSRSTDGGLTWSPFVRINDDIGNAWQWFGTMSVAPSGRIDVIWNDTRNDPGGFLSEVHYSSSADGGLTWSTNQAITPAFNPFLGYPQQSKIGDYYDMISDDVGASLAFSATFNGEQDVWFLRLGEADCNGNGVPDSSDIALGNSTDGDQNGIPDECETLLMLDITPGPAGNVNSLHTTRTTPGEDVYFFVGTLPGTLPIGACPGLNLDMLDPRLLGVFGGGPRGRITLGGFIDGSFSGLTFLFQAIELSTCHVSNLVTHTF